MPYATQTFNFWTGDVVRDKISGDLYKVVKLNPKNAKCQAADGRLWTIDQRRLEKATDEQAADYRGQVFVRETTTELLRLGHVVKFKTADKKEKQGYFVVTKVKAEGVSLAFLGGNLQSRYWPTVPNALLEKTDGIITFTNV